MVQRERWVRVSWCVVALMLGAGCKRSPPPEEVPLELGGRESTPAALPSYPDDVWDDPKLRGEDRLQFTWRHPDEEERSVWSMRLDGTDIRRVARPELLYTAGAASLRSLAPRSPDGRYFLFVGDHQESRGARFLVDLKERKVRLVRQESLHADVGWSPDSRYAFFLDDALDDRYRTKVIQYDVKTGELKEAADFSADGLALVDGGKHFIAFHNHSVAFHDRAGKQRKLVRLPDEVDAPYGVSPDGKLLLFSTDYGETIIAARSRPEVFLHRDKVQRGAIIFGRDGETLIYTNSDGEVRAFDWSSGSDRHLATFREWMPADVSLVFARGTR